MLVALVMSLVQNATAHGVALFTLTALALAGFGGQALDRTGPSSDAGAIETQRKACKQDCAESEAKATDRTTCELVCDTQADNRTEGPSVTRWKTDKQMGGPAPGVPVGATPSGEVRTTTTTTTARSTDTSTATSPSSRPVTASDRSAQRDPAQAAAWHRRAAQAQCQARCDRTAADAVRWRCKLHCLRAKPGATPVAAPLGQDAATATSR